MNFEEIIDIIQNETPVDNKALELSEELHKKFPYTSLFPMLILKGLKTNKNLHFDEQLKKLSIQVNDREVLEKYLEFDSSTTSSAASTTTVTATTTSTPSKVIRLEEVKQYSKPKVEEEKTEIPISKQEQESKPESKKEQKELQDSENSTTNVPDKKEEKPSVAETHKETIKSASTSLELAPETKRIIAEIQKKYGDKEAENKEIKEEKVEPISAKGEITDQKDLTIEKEPSVEPEKKEINTEVEDLKGKDQEVQQKSPDHSIEEQKPAKAKKKKKAKKDKKKLKEKIASQNFDSPFKFKEFKGEDDEYYHLEIDFSDLEPIHQQTEEQDDLEDFDFIKHPEIDILADSFIKEKQQPKTQEKKKKSKDKTDSNFDRPVKIDISSKAEMTFLDWLKANKKTEEAKQKGKSGEQSNSAKIIDRFIEETPSISTPKKEFFSPTKNAKKSLEDEMEIVSETLAELHIFQENYTKAKKVYEKLILKFPQKKSLFAKKIEEIAYLKKKNN